ncbi:MAG: indolepyruvate ferredoxin oxidoreductase subunit alpha [Thermoguttaceae bacterium]|jgi:indolepyruvate ferredoxin oxidoreductase alpha subunit
MKELLSGNEAIARGAYEAGVVVATGYPGTPSTEVLETLVRFKGEVYCEWSPNEKVAFEVAAGASLSGARAIVTMKHVGLNVAADPLMTLAYTGTVGGLVAVVADDPGMHSSQNEQDTRHFARFAKVPMLEPSDSREAKEMVALGLEISEEFRTPVILRSSTRVSHSRSLVTLSSRAVSQRPLGFEKNPARFVSVPQFARGMRVRLEERLARLSEAANRSPANRIEHRGRRLGIVTSGIAYQYVREVFPEASVLKLGWVYPFPNVLIREFAAAVDEILIVEELDDILEQHVLALGIPCQGKNVVPRIGELSPDVLLASRAKLDGKTIPAEARTASTTEIGDLPGRPPVLCAGCPHRGIYHALNKCNVVVTGDIGCYSLGALPPLSRMDTLLCMGAGVTMAHGMDKAGEPRRVVGILGDSTFFHSGITGLLDIAYNRGASTIIVVDNRTTAMTGHQPHPGTGRTLMGDPSPRVSIEDVGRACGIKNVVTIDPYDLKNTVSVLKRAIASDEPWLVVSRAACLLDVRQTLGPPLHVDEAACRECGACLKLGCPALECGGGIPRVNPLLCAGCGLCNQVCPAGAFEVEKEVAS